jgi:hypothetical protein
MGAFRLCDREVHLTKAESDNGGKQFALPLLDVVFQQPKSKPSKNSIMATSGTERYGTKWIIARWRARIRSESTGLGAAPRAPEFLFEERHKIGAA